MSEDESSTREDLQLRARVDRSLRLPLLFFFTSAAAWLLLATILGFLSSLTLSLPTLFESMPWLQYGRLQPAHMNALVYGWAFQAAFGAAYWMVARLGRVPLRRPMALLVGGHLWNLTVTLGVLAIFFGWGTSVAWLDFPNAFWPVLLLSYVVIMVALVGMFAVRRNREGFISQWYVLAAVFWFPWVYLTANGMIHGGEGAAVFKAAVNGWYISNVIYMFLAPIALAAAYYLVSKTTGRPVYSEALAHLGFWTLVLFSGWTGISRYLGGPLPAWIPSVSSAAAIFLLIPGVAVLSNLFRTLDGKLGWAAYSPALRFTVFGVVAFLVTLVLGVLLAIIPMARTIQFTYAQTAYELLALYGFFSMTLFGAIYFIVPRVVGCEWPSGSMIRFHFWFSAYGIIAMVAFMFFAGLAQGHLHAQWTEEFLVSVERTRPYLASLGVGWSLILISNLAFLLQLGLMSIRRGRRSGEGPTLIHKKPQDYFTDQMIAEEGANA